ncbi:YxeA family protein [Gottschalkia acidurici]|uniref:YxeA family protein n=1 Tax=Clostridium acidurici TaxID=1556 RepID=UPI000684A568|nr:YxeA family protein [Gottschalkia acidurici]
MKKDIKRKKFIKNTIILLGVTTVIVFLGTFKFILDDPFIIKKLMHPKYYVKITEDGEYTSDKDRKPWSYYYETKAYSRSGKEIKVRFYANKNLRKDAYLSVYLCGGPKESIYDIELYEEVNLNDLPKNLKNKLN